MSLGVSNPPFCAPLLFPVHVAYCKTLLLQPHGILSHGFTALVIARVPAEGEPFRQPEEAMLALSFCHDDPQQDDEQDNEDCDGEQIEELSVSGSVHFT